MATNNLRFHYLPISLTVIHVLLPPLCLPRPPSPIFFSVGAHLNPAVSLSFCVLGQTPWGRLVPYSLSQLLGAYVASGLVYLVYYGLFFWQLKHFILGSQSSCKIYAKKHLSYSGGYTLDFPLYTFANLFVLLFSASDAIMEFSGGVLTVYGPNETASIFATYPSPYMTLGRSFLDQVSGRIHVNLNYYFNSCSFIELIITACTFTHFIRSWAPAC